MLETAGSLLYPPLCLGCGVPTAGYSPEFLCPACHLLLRPLDARTCRFCGAGAGEDARLGHGCARCDGRSFHFTRAAAVCPYGPPARELIKAFKFSGERRLAGPLSARMASRACEERFPAHPDAVLPVPLHPIRERERGYNQAALLAAGIAAALHAPLAIAMLTRVRETQPQAQLHPLRRVENPVNAFAAARCDGAVLWLVDDVITSGTTVSECARVLREAGATRVYALAFARG